MHEISIVHSLFLVFAGAAVMATLALFTRQALLLSYIAIGVLFGPSALDLVSNPDLIADIASIGIIFLLFLLGLNLELSELQRLFREAITVTFLSCLIFFLLSVALALLFKFSWPDSMLIGITMMFSSTIIALKLLPTSALHHQRMGEMIVSVLLLQDILAILILIALHAFADSENLLKETVLLVVGLPMLAIGCWSIAKHWLVKLYHRFDQFHEYLFLLAIAWCLGIAELATFVGSSHEVGAFIAGVTLATSPVARFMAESLKPLRDFFLVLFFFSLGAGLRIAELPTVILPATLFALLAVFVKPTIFSWLLKRQHETASLTRETGARLGQISEFSLLIIVVATNHALISDRAGVMIQSATIFSFLISSYWIVKFYPTPISPDPALRRD